MARDPRMDGYIDTSTDHSLASASSIDLDRGLERFGFASFRPGQREAIETLLAIGRLLLVAPTGGGKSLIYQLPASLLPGTTLVVSPLVSLMNDQVLALERLGISATFLAATIDGMEMRQRMRDVARGRYDLLYVAPERLAFEGFRSLVLDLNVPLVAVDEAHCISEWGHDFRPDYLQIGDLISRLPQARILACTATATPIVRDEILVRLGLGPKTPQLVRGFARPNLSLRAREVRGKKDRELLVDVTLQEVIGEPRSGRGVAIVYAPTRKTTEAESDRLESKGWRSRAYHAGLAAETRDDVHGAFAAGDLDVVVATNAFGMGIDRPDVRAVVHLAPPSSVESYYQEVGRAGRDGEDAVGLLLVSPGDMALRRRLIEGDGFEFAPDAETVRHKWNLFLELMRWAEGGSCRHDAILRYFGDEEETLAGCGRCDVCLDLASDDGRDPEETSVIVRKALSAVARIRGRFGIQLAGKFLRGVHDERLQLSGLDETKTFGSLSEHSEEWIMRLLRRCVTAGWVDFTGGDRPVVVLTQEGRDVVMGDAPVRLLLPSKDLRPISRGARSGSKRGESGRAGGPGAGGTGGSGSSGTRSTSGAGSAGGDVLDPAAQELFESLRHHRLEVAKSKSVPPYVVASDRTLREIASIRPRTLSELALVHGIGPAKVEKYGDGLLQVVREHE
ncbi:MAG: ATP-dependent DNA helicase RecQ [Candidatus Eisenbacteria bacterium]|uniref:ATP-dependent DNA helicase RecQ n=1 Tax=Eiseniibacteriota bacterium TaxID=2212470 RepID=A0A956SE89_UNCEI|nr:ATP-dependent DNA helicase RecQ [Candidatus Eisenbacteria bacterium]